MRAPRERLASCTSYRSLLSSSPGSGLDRVPHEPGARVVALVGVPGRAVERGRELVAVRYTGPEAPEVDRRVHRGQRAVVNDRVAAVARGVGPAILDHEVDLVRHRVGAVGVGQLVAAE